MCVCVCCHGDEAVCVFVWVMGRSVCVCDGEEAVCVESVCVFVCHREEVGWGGRRQVEGRTNTRRPGIIC